MSSSPVLTEPFTISDIACPSGRLGIMPLPGRNGQLETDLATIVAWQPSLVISLVEPDELATLGLSHLPAEILAQSIPLLACPIPDFGIPEAVNPIEPALASASDALQTGGSVLLHCHGGRGRSGMIAARLLVLSGASPSDAIRQVRAARPGAIETSQQEAWITGS